ncbi:MAG TPA: YidC/Oxa1 family membrane protein insertase [Bacilli bacterium]|nr:YidC/Oxa1 family membrane protein insertase [Bacilli bacterium]
MKKKVMLILLLLIFCTTGCTKYMQSDDNERIKYEETGQTLPSNILCKPVTEDLLEIYAENEDKMVVKLADLPSCDDFQTSDIKYVSIWESGFVKPLAWLILKVGQLLKNYGLSVMLIGFFIKLILFPLTKNSMNQSENMKKAQPEIARLEKKYANKNDQESMMKKSQETMAIYKKHNINPLMGCLMAFIQLPIFFAFLEAINRVPAIFEEKLFGLQLGTNPVVGIGKGNYLYIILIILIIATTYFSLKNTMQTTAGVGAEGAQKQTQLMSKIMLVMISIASLTLPAAIALYWIVTNAFTVVQNFIMKRKKKNENK